MCKTLVKRIHYNEDYYRVMYLLTIISSPSPVARHNEPATLVAIFSSGSVTIGRPAQRTSVPVVCALHRGLPRRTTKINIRPKNNRVYFMRYKHTMQVKM